MGPKAPPHKTTLIDPYRALPKKPHKSDPSKRPAHYFFPRLHKTPPLRVITNQSL